MSKRIWLFLLVAALLLSFSACGKTPAEQAPPEVLVTDPITLIDMESLVLRVLKIEPDNEAGYTVSIMVWNRSDIEFNFIFDDLTLNDLLYGEVFQFTVSGGEKELKRITLSPAKMEQLGLTKVTKIGFRFYGLQTDITFDAAYFDQTLSFYPLGEAAYKTYQRAVDTDVILIDNEYCTLTYVESTTDMEELLHTLYFVNKTDKPLTLIAKQGTINGTPYNAYKQLELKPGCKGYELLTYGSISSDGEGIQSFAADVDIYYTEKYADGPVTTVSVSVP